MLDLWFIYVGFNEQFPSQSIYSLLCQDYQFQLELLIKISSQMGINEKKFIYLKGRFSHQHQIIHPPQLNSIIQIKQILLKHKLRLENKIMNSFSLSQTHRDQWDKILHQSMALRRSYLQQIGPLIRNLNYNDYIDQEIKDKMLQDALTHGMKYFKFQQYVQEVAFTIAYPKQQYCPLLQKFVQKKIVKIVLDKEYFLQFKEISWQEIQISLENQKKEIQVAQLSLIDKQN